MSKGIIQFIKFGLVGVSNTLIAYGVEMLCYYVLFKDAEFTGIRSALSSAGITAASSDVTVVMATAMGFIVSVTNSYILNNRFVFKDGRKTLSGHVRTYCKTVLCYALTGLVLAPFIKLWLTNAFIMPFWAASFLSLFVTVPLNFVMNKYWAFRREA